MRQISLEDGKRALQVIRSRAQEWHLNPQRIGIAGVNVGGNVALHVLSGFEVGKDAGADVTAISSRPDFVVLLSCWAAKETTSPYLLRRGSPPVYLCHPTDDTTAPVALAQDITRSLQALGVAVVLWEIPKGGHGAFALAEKNKGHGWPEHFLPWLYMAGLLGSIPENKWGP